MTGSTELSILRPHDLVALDFRLVNLRVSADGQTLVPGDESAEAFVVVTFPPQAMSETVVSAEPPRAVPPLRTALAGPSRLVFRLPAGQGLPLTTEALLAWNDWTPVVAPTALLPRGTPGSAALPERVPPTELETAVEFPWRLLLSPVEDGRWHTDNGASLGGAHQLWSAVLATATGRGGDVRALTARAGPDPDFPTSLSDGPVGDREQIARLSSDFHLPTGDGTYFTPVPLTAGRLELTALGANTELEAGWDYPEFAAEGEAPPPSGYVPLSLRQYMHIAALGRDTLVRTVKAGYLCPTGHRAVVVESVERLPQPVNAGGARGVLVRTAELIVQQPVVDYVPLVPAFARAGREFPFASVQLTTTSARIDASESVDAKPVWLRDPDSSIPIGFRAVGLDVAGHALDFSLPLMFVTSGQIRSPRTISDAYFSSPDEPPITVTLGGQSMAAAAEAPGRPGPTTLKVESLDWSLELPPGASKADPDFAMQPAPPWYVPCFLPRITNITASVPAIDELLGMSGPVDFTLDPVYLEHGFETANRAQVFVSLTSELPLELSPQRGGGLASPALAVTAVSRTLGPVSAPDKLQAGQVDVAAFSRMKLLGTITLMDLLDTQRMDFMGGDSAGAEVAQTQLDQPEFVLNPPRLTSRRLPAAGPGGSEGVETRFLWKPPLARQGNPLLDLTGADLLLDATTRKVRGQEAVTEVNGRLRKVGLTFAGALSARIGVLAFRSESGKKVEVEATAVKIEFEDPLKFVDALLSVLPSDGFADPPFLTVDGQGVVSGYTLGVPSVSVGVVSVQNIAVTAALSIPFTDRPAGLRFAVSERHKPFLVTVSLFGGGGFFAVEAGAKGLEQLEASIEFGGSVSLNLGVASGGVSVMAGIYFGMKGASVELTGYLRCGGYLEVLGLISVSLEFYLAFTYGETPNGGTEVWGQASLTVRVKIAFISKSVTVSVERHFAGSGGDPTFQQCFSPTQWAGYLEAFA
ncbi:hypothetical protein [Streptomyces sp900129855]|uniref:Uncharacterized protein n=1 Tax=Streptomyces sp. 900129855 TaxID=3155129 RepID=A0ABV2ZKP9_9ACTN